MKKKDVKESKPEPIEKKVQESKAPVTLQEHLDAGWVDATQSGKLQGQGKKVVEIKNVEGETLHRLED